MKTSVIILAAGKGTRMKSSVHKQYINIFDKPILYYTLKRFSDNDMIDEIMLVTSKDEINFCKKNIIEKYNISKVSNIVEGGKERHESVFNGLKKAKGSEIVLIHDGVRPFVSDRIIEEGIELANKYGAAACGVKPKDTIKIIGKDRISKSTLNRDELFCVQTPQVFNYNLIFNCHENIKNSNLKITDDTMVVESCGHKVFLYEGNYENIKITTPEDLIIAKEIIKKYTY